MASTYPTSLDAFTNPAATDLLTSPSHAQQHSDINDAMEALQTKLAIGNTVIGTYTAYTPTWTNLAVGNGTVVSSYCRVNNLIHYTGGFSFGTTTVVSSTIAVSLPVTQRVLNASYNMCQGWLEFVDVSAGTLHMGSADYRGNANAVSLEVGNVGGTYAFNVAVNVSVPFTWATNDKIFWNLTYEAA